MTDEQTRVFMQMACYGWTLGLHHPFEWLMDMDRHSHFLADTIGFDADKGFDAMLAFVNENDGPSEHPTTMDDLMERIDAHYDQERLRKETILRVGAAISNEPDMEKRNEFAKAVTAAIVKANERWGRRDREELAKKSDG